jgi:hypothetical protein
LDPSLQKTPSASLAGPWCLTELEELAATLRLDSIDQADFDTVFYPAAMARCGTWPKTATRSR